jgi:hypothetical protein
MAMPSQSELTEAIANAARLAFSSLFKEYPGSFHYCTLVTYGEAPPPYVSAWSHEALSLVPEHKAHLLKWSCAESPFCFYGDKYFDEVNRLFSERPAMAYDLTEEAWNAEHELRLGAMEAAMARLDSEGLFGVGDARNKTVILVEVMPPDHANTERALRLNPPEALTEWMVEAAE